MDETIYTLFARQVAQHPEAPAVMDERRTLTYAELDALAETLISAFPTPDLRHVGVVLNHGVERLQHCSPY